MKRGEPLVSIYAPEYLTAQSEYIQAIKSLKRAKQTNNLEEENTAKSIYESAKWRLINFGATEKEIIKLEETLAPQPYLVVYAPFDGSIVESNVISGEYVESGKNLYKLADLSLLWVIADVYERDIAKIRPGQLVEITTTAYPDMIFEGKVLVVGDVLDERTRTFKVRIEVNNSEGRLKPEMFVKVSIIASNKSVLSIPKGAILMDGGNRIVFVLRDSNLYVSKEVKVGEETDDLAEIINGLEVGENVVIEGNFLLKSELLKSKMGAGCAE